MKHHTISKPESSGSLNGPVIITNATNKPVTSFYRGFTLHTTCNGGATQTIVYNTAGEPVLGSFSHLDKLASVEKACIKIDNYLKGGNKC